GDLRFLFRRRRRGGARAQPEEPGGERAHPGRGPRDLRGGAARAGLAHLPRRPPGAAPRGRRAPLPPSARRRSAGVPPLNAAQVGFVAAVLLSATASAAVGIIALGRARRLDVLPWLGVMALAQAIWSLFFACKLVAPTLETKVLWDKAEWVPVMVA